MTSIIQRADSQQRAKRIGLPPVPCQSCDRESTVVGWVVLLPIVGPATVSVAALVWALMS